MPSGIATSSVTTATCGRWRSTRSTPSPRNAGTTWPEHWYGDVDGKQQPPFVDWLRDRASGSRTSIGYHHDPTVDDIARLLDDCKEGSFPHGRHVGRLVQRSGRASTNVADDRLVAPVLRQRGGDRPYDARQRPPDRPRCDPAVRTSDTAVAAGDLLEVWARPGSRDGLTWNVPPAAPTVGRITVIFTTPGIGSNVLTPRRRRRQRKSGALSDPPDRRSDPADRS